MIFLSWQNIALCLIQIVTRIPNRNILTPIHGHTYYIFRAFNVSDQTVEYLLVISRFFIFFLLIVIEKLCTDRPDSIDVVGYNITRY